MLQKLRVVKYQSHRDTEIIFSPGITGIIGKSLSGKTALLRALGWVINNRPSGFGFHSHFAKGDTEVSLELDDAKVVKTGGKKKEYRIGDQTFQKFGTKVPDVVKSTINMDEINIQHQLEPPYLITSPPGRIAETINKVTNIQKITEWVRTINRKTNRLKSTAGVVSDDIDELTDEIKAFKGLDKVERLIMKAKAIDNKLNKLYFERGEIQAVVASIEMSEKEIKRLKRQAKLAKRLDGLVVVQGRLDDLEYEKELLERVVKQVRIVDTAKGHRDKLCSRYIKRIKKTKKCPTCFSPIKESTIKRINREIFIAVRHSRNGKKSRRSKR